MNRIFKILITIGLGSCAPKQETKFNSEPKNIIPFEIRITDSDYSMAYGLQYVLTEKDLKIVFESELEGEKDSLIYSSGLEATEALKKLSDLNLNDLQDHYANPCIEDGSQITVEFKKENKSKTVHLSNYYHNEIGIAIEQINELAPAKYRIWYDKESLFKDQMNCK